MRPIGLTVKKTHKKYARFEQGELMLVHLCAECGKVSINRIAADDNDQVMLEIFRESADLEPPLLDRLAEQGIRLLGPDDLPLVHRQLYGSRPAPN